MHDETDNQKHEGRPSHFVDVGGFGLVEFSAGLCAVLFLLMAMTIGGLLFGLNGRQGVPGTVLCLGFAAISAYACSHTVTLGSEALKPRRTVPAAESASGRIVNVHDGSTYGAVRMGLQMKQWPTLVKPIVVLWIATSAVFGVWASIGMQKWIASMLADRGAWPMLVIPFVLHMAFLLACNIFIVLGTAVLTRHPETLEAIWRGRFGIDLLITIGVVVYSII